MLPGLEMMSCPNLAVPAEVMQHIVKVESSHNPYAIGVVGGQLVRQPQNLGEALATVRMLEDQGYNFSVGLAQVNRANLGKYGLDSYEKAFSPCANLAVGARILSECYASSGNDWGKAFSCYYSGNFVTGYRDGYVQKVYDSINRSMKLASNQAMAIPVVAANQAAVRSSSKSVAYAPINDSSYRIALRSVALDTAASAIIAPAVARAAGLPSASPANVGYAPTRPGPQPLPDNSANTMQPTPATVAQSAPAGMPYAGNAVAANVAPDGAAPAQANAASDEIFVPRVRGPNDAAPTAGQQAPAVAPQMAVSTGTPNIDQADLRQGSRDDAFVF
ncbi:lytic transglycosylase domain-containing protein [Dyella koreensis]|uniref:Transglycosylase SLT domain-containing protein n=1 Tax=Dyella koreensis TaxID=311235 RepID=A0ABW8K1W5_9GAMM